MQFRIAEFLGGPASRRLILTNADVFSIIWRCSIWFLFLQPSIKRAGETPAFPGAQQIETAKKMQQLKNCYSHRIFNPVQTGGGAAYDFVSPRVVLNLKHPAPPFISLSRLMREIENETNCKMGIFFSGVVDRCSNGVAAGTLV
jgi:Leu/Phe-tRNA-protein transferase